MTEIPTDLLERIAERAIDPMRRTYMAGALANAVPFDFGEMMTAFQHLAPPQAQGVFGMISKIQSLFGDKMPGFTMMAPGGMATFGQPTGPQPLAPPPGDAEIGEAEKAVGRSLPGEVRQLYAIGDGGFGPGNGLLPLAEAVGHYRSFTREPYGPSEEEWPANLLPLFDENPALSCIDLDSGEIVIWDPEELEDEDSVEDWRRSFKVEHPSLASLMTNWVESPTFEEEQRRDY